jgi:hypothetical protein
LREQCALLLQRLQVYPTTKLSLLAACLLVMRRGMAALAEEVPQLQELNISWCAGEALAASTAGRMPTVYSKVESKPQKQQLADG